MRSLAHALRRRLRVATLAAVVVAALAACQPAAMPGDLGDAAHLIGSGRPSSGGSSSPAPAVDTDVLLQDTFAHTPGRYVDGATVGPWRVVFAGYGGFDITGRADAPARLVPKVAERPDTTHATLVVSQRTFSGVDLTTRLRTSGQLRPAAPNPWETGWVVWSYADNTHFSYFVLKPNGWELGKADPAYPGAQRFLATGESPRLTIGRWNDVRVRQVGAEVDVWVDGVHVVHHVDTERPYTSGAVGLYTEDADVQATHVTVRAPR
jgi:hypothetical protein